LFARLATQLVPAVVVAIVGLLALANLARPPQPVPIDAPATTVIATEAVFTATPREAAEQPAKSAAPRPSVNPKTAAPLPQRKPEPAPRQSASAPTPLPTVQIAEPVALAPPIEDPSMIDRLRSATMSVVQAPQRAARSMVGWFQPSEPPRPPGAVPQHFQAQM
jgi:hypothetical protein